MTRWIVAIALFFTQEASAQNKAAFPGFKDSDVTGFGTQLCKVIVASPIAASEFLGWSQGFLTGLNISQPAMGTSKIDLGESVIGPSEQRSFLTSYCIAHPEDYAWRAPEALWRTIALRMETTARKRLELR